jgi:hypothetical protein
MYQNLVNQNPMVCQFNGYVMQNPTIVPFQDNQLINKNPHVVNNLNDFVQEHRMIQQNIPVYQQQFLKQMQQPIIMAPMQPINMAPMQPINMAPMQPINIVSPINTNQMNQTRQENPKNRVKNSNIIEEMLKPIKIKKDTNTNKDVLPNYSVRNEIRKNAKKGKINIKITNAPYKNIIRDKIITKKVEDIKQEDLIVHKVIPGVDDNIERFNKELKIMEDEKEKINDELEIEFHIDNYDTHKKNFEFKETFIKNLAFEQNTFDENKQDYVDFYKQKQKEAEKGIKLVDQVLENLIDEGIISKDELPIETPHVDNNDLDLETIISNVQTDEMFNLVNKESKQKISDTNKIQSKKMKAISQIKTNNDIPLVTTKNFPNNNIPKRTTNPNKQPTINKKIENRNLPSKTSGITIKNNKTIPQTKTSEVTIQNNKTIPQTKTSEVTIQNNKAIPQTKTSKVTIQNNKAIPQTKTSEITIQNNKTKDMPQTKSITKIKRINNKNIVNV